MKKKITGVIGSGIIITTMAINYVSYETVEINTVNINQSKSVAHATSATINIEGKQYQITTEKPVLLSVKGVKTEIEVRKKKNIFGFSKYSLATKS